MSSPGSVSSASTTNNTSAQTSIANDNVRSTGAQTARNLIGQSTNPVTGAVDTRALAGMIADAARQNPAAASAAFAQIEAQLGRNNFGDASRFSRDVQAAFSAQNTDPGRNNPVPGTALFTIGSQIGALGRTQYAAGVEQINRGAQMLRNNPVLSVRREATTSAWTQNGGLSGPLADRLRAGGIEVSTSVNAPPAGSVGRNIGVTRGIASNMNGGLAENAIASRFSAQGFNVTQGANMYVGGSSPNNIVQGGARVIDVVAERPNVDPRMNQRIEVESKVGYTVDAGRAAREATNDIARLADNRAARTTGTALETAGTGLSRSGQILSNVGRVARPVGVVMDAIEIGQSYRADGNQIGANTGRTLAGVAAGAGGAWAGAAAGAAIGSVVPGVGTVIGGVVGGLIGAFAGDTAGRGVFDFARGWF